MRANVEVMRRRHGIAGDGSFEEHGHDEADIGTVPRAAIGVVVHENVAGTNLLRALLQHLPDAFDVAGDRARLKRRALLGLRELPPLGVRLVRDRTRVDNA